MRTARTVGAALQYSLFHFEYGHFAAQLRWEYFLPVALEAKGFEMSLSFFQCLLQLAPVVAFHGLHEFGRGQVFEEPNDVGAPCLCGQFSEPGKVLILRQPRQLNDVVETLPPEPVEVDAG